MVKKKKQDINLLKKKQSPSNFRIITDTFTHFVQKEKILLFASFLGLLLFGIVVGLSAQLYEALQQQKTLQSVQDKVAYEISFWQQVVKLRPDYRDGYFMLATLQYRVGKKQEAKVNLTKALKIDPNFKEGREFEKILAASN